MRLSECPVPRSILADMGRQKRPYSPGTIFHLVSRTHRREPLLVPGIRAAIASLIQQSVGRTDAQLLAYVVMPNHLHVVLRQDRSELSAVMQPLMRRVAHIVQRQNGFEGTVVERRYRDRACRTADHVREVLLYVHLNAWKAGLCGDDLGYRWMTHRAYAPGADPRALGIDPQAQMRVLELFAAGPQRSRDQLCEDYARWISWRMKRARSSALEESAPLHPACVAPSSMAGDHAWHRSFAPPFRYSLEPRHRLLPDLRDYIAAELPRLAPGCTTEQLRGRRVPRQVSRYRARMMRAAADRGYRTGDLARFFQVSPTTVSLAKYAPSEELR